MCALKKVFKGGGDKIVQIIAGVYMSVSVCDYHKVFSGWPESFEGTATFKSLFSAAKTPDTGQENTLRIRINWIMV